MSWSTPLSRPIHLANGAKVHTLAEAGAVVLHAGEANTVSETAESVYQRLKAAAKSRRAHDVFIATEAAYAYLLGAGVAKAGAP